MRLLRAIIWRRRRAPSGGSPANTIIDANAALVIDGNGDQVVSG